MRTTSIEFTTRNLSSAVDDGRLSFLLDAHAEAGDIYHLDNIVLSAISRAHDETSTAGSVQDYWIEQNYPNPFNPTTTIRFKVPRAEEVTVTVYDLLGREIATLVDTFLQSGLYEVVFESATLPSGVYLYSMRAGSFVDTRKMVLLR
jgi:hypothetical protein